MKSHAKFISNPANSNHLQKSLSQVLSKFYPLAGHLVDDLYVDCNDEGVPYVEAVANCSLSQCGGTAVGLVISHKIADGSSFFVANSWAAVARNGNCDDLPGPKFEGAKIFSPQDPAGFKPSTGIVMIEELVTKIFTFPASKNPTSRKDPNKIYTVLHAVNLRTRLDPPLSEYHFGNIYWLAIAKPTVGADNGSELLQKLRKAIRGLNGEYVAQLQQGISI
ncbi:UNVERIFIED_CONTAM: Stemmadenine O-acetyltransferase [Sesamum latifolium]|uniref:Stemmadenine O-acetyltransferase n=1 Tax=Sesamum latifolium TaxID=2727402 RepID=A0AAW2VZS5_9LAMI